MSLSVMLELSCLNSRLKSMENKSSECIYPLCDTSDSRDISWNLSRAWISQSASY